MIILIMGPQGSGKGSVAERLAHDAGYVHISTGDLLRAEIR
ncbi:MAG: nucleoside monophosphate kinase, partial [Nanoarchaeota archaeon]